MLPSSLFIVRVWHETDAEGRTTFCATVRAVDAEDAKVFTSAATLARYFAESCRRVIAPDNPPRRAGS